MALGLCRDCFSRIEDPAAHRCGNCNSSRIARHPELTELSIAHIDCDAFYASIEKRDDPSLADKPTIVGGGKRGVVSTACYIARTFGVRSAMPMFKALQLCPHATVIRPDMAKYAEVSRQVRTIFESATPLVESVSLDEAYLDMAGTQSLHHAPPAFVLARIARRIEDEIGITVSIGLSFNKLLAKLASELDKPRGFGVVGPGEARAFLAARVPRILPGVGPKLAQRLADDGFASIGDLQKVGELALEGRYGETGRWLAAVSQGRDDRSVEPEREAKSISAETTFHADLGRLVELEAELWPLAEEVAERLKRHHLVGRTVQLKLRTADFRLLTRRVTLPAGTQLAETLYRAAQPMLAREVSANRHRKYRLIGIGAAELAEPGKLPVQDDLFGKPAAAVDDPRDAAVEKAIDAVRDKFGSAAIRKGRGMGVGKVIRPGRDLPRSPR
ncbi:MAG: DNA polymerase IV [Alphaproteobacteria bacterium]|nr:DNA polymerase IV [Alphaproteobacteria bacterium]